MKRLLLLLALCVMVGSVSATALNFQSSGDLNQINTTWGSSPVTWVESTTGGNNYVSVPPKSTTGSYLINKVAFPTSYAAATCLNDGSNGVFIKLYDVSGTIIGSEYGVFTGVGRYEVSIVGGTPYIYKNGILVATGAFTSANPYYVGFGAGGFGNSQWDDFIYGDSEKKHITGIPEQNAFFIKKDMVTPSASGLYNSTSGLLASSTNMLTSWGRGNITYGGNESIYLINVDTGTIYGTQYTDTASSGTNTWNIQTLLIGSSAPYGRYQIHFGDYYSTPIAYIADGAEINFDKASYNQQDTAVITYNIDGAYWDTSTYTYLMKIYSANLWTVVDNVPITSSSGTISYTFTTSDPQGEYYAVIGATPNAGGSFIWMNYDYASLTAYATFYGWVNDAETTLPISGANVSFSQGSIVSNSITPASGNYTASGFLTGAILTINVTKSGYSQYYVTLTPMVAKSIPLNITLNSTTPTITGLGIGGVDRTGILTGTLITKGYGQPIEGATCYAKNTTNSQSCSTITNMAAWYKFDESNGCVLTSKRPYDVWCQKAGYSNSQNYTVVAA